MCRNEIGYYRLRDYNTVKDCLNIEREVLKLEHKVVGKCTFGSETVKVEGNEVIAVRQQLIRLIQPFFPTREIPSLSVVRKYLCFADFEWNSSLKFLQFACLITDRDFNDVKRVYYTNEQMLEM